MTWNTSWHLLAIMDLFQHVCVIPLRGVNLTFFSHYQCFSFFAVFEIQKCKFAMWTKTVRHSEIQPAEENKPIIYQSHYKNRDDSTELMNKTITQIHHPRRPEAIDANEYLVNKCMPVQLPTKDPKAK